MELLVFVIGLCVLGYLATRFGYDSRAVPYSKEEDLARLGVIWEVHASHLADLRREADHWRLAQSTRVLERPRRITAQPLSRRVRRGMAASLLTLARWLSPELSTS
jgi:hypothetical protein